MTKQDLWGMRSGDLEDSEGKESTEVELKRDPLEIVRDILSNSGSSRTQIRLSVGLTSAQVSRYLNLLVENRLFEERTARNENGRTLYVTPKGERLLRVIEELAGALGLSDSM